MSDLLDGLPGRAEAIADKARVRELESVRDVLASTVQKMAASQYKLRLPKPPKTPRGDYLRVIAGDLHGQHMDPAAFAAFVRDVKRLAPKEVVLLGDWIDCGGWLSEHPTLHLTETVGSFEDDVAAGNQALDALTEAAPGARLYYLEGNHEWRVIKTILKMTKGSRQDSAWLMERLGIKALLSLEDRGIEFIRHDELMPGLTIRGTLRLGDWCFTHGPFKRCGVSAVRRNLSSFKGNFVQGHIHRQVHETQQSFDRSAIHGYSFGCLCQFQPYYMENSPTDWAHGYGVQFVRKGGTASTWAVSIEDGSSDLSQFLKMAELSA